MFWAKDVDSGEIIKAEPGGFGICPVCGSAVKAKCGDIYRWHWSHLNFDDARKVGDCDSWSEYEGDWHLRWKERVPINMREVVLRRPYTRGEETGVAIHRADILNSRGTVIELQHSNISSSEIQEREAFYQDMIWIFDASEFKFQDHTRVENGHRYQWKRPRKPIWDCTKPVFFHFGDRNIFRIKKIQRTIPCYIEGVYENFKTLLDIFFK